MFEAPARDRIAAGRSGREKLGRGPLPVVPGDVPAGSFLHRPGTPRIEHVHPRWREVGLVARHHGSNRGPAPWRPAARRAPVADPARADGRSAAPPAHPRAAPAPRIPGPASRPAISAARHLQGIASLHPQHADLQFHQRQRRHAAELDPHIGHPCGHARVAAVADHPVQFGQDVGVEQVQAPPLSRRSRGREAQSRALGDRTRSPPCLAWPGPRPACAAGRPDAGTRRSSATRAPACRYR